ncbi:MAG: ABC transporter permease [Clostridioides sp.]|nr:ABC transporter permease [Clostridioides sp.]
MGLIKNSLANLKGHKLRVFVAILWIVIGITSVVLVTSIGNGFQKEVAKSIDIANDKKTRIDFESSDASMNDFSAFLSPFTNRDLEELSFVTGVEKVTPAKDFYQSDSEFYSEAKYDRKASSLSISPIKKDSYIDLIAGREFSLDDDNRKVIIITDNNANELFGDASSAIGKGITVNGINFEVIGVISGDETALNEGRSQFDNYRTVMSLVPVQSFKDLLRTQYDQYTTIYALDVYAKKGYNAYDVANNVIGKLNENHPDINGTYTTPDPSEQANAMKEITDNVNKFVSVVTVVAMAVGGVGIMNVMYISVMERQREIGIRRAIGAKPRSILLQFLVESVIITIAGGIIGIVVGLIASKNLYRFTNLGYEPVANVESFVYALAATVITGVIFGLVPAFKASRLDPIKAIYK